MTKYFIYTIIAGFILSFSGCGYKGDPIYVEDRQIETKSDTKESSK